MSRLLASLLLLLPLPLRAEDLPGVRGPRGDGTSTEKGIPTTFSPTKNVRWKAAIPGTGFSSPVIHGDRVFLTTCIEEKGDRVLLCLHRRTGETLWSRV